MSESNNMGGFTLGLQDDGSILCRGWDSLTPNERNIDNPATIYHLFKHLTIKQYAILRIKEMLFF